MSFLYGIHSVLEALKADAGRIEKITFQRGLYGPRLQQVIDLARQAGRPISFEDKAALDRKAGDARHQGVLCQVSEAPTLEVEDLLQQASTPALFVVLDGIEDPQNLGAILRSAEVAGADGVFLPRRRAAGLTGSAVKASAGAASHIRIARFSSPGCLIESLKQRGLWLTGLAAEAGKNLWEVDFRLPSVLVLGGEGGGLHRLVRKKCDFLASIPVRGKVGSYNVSVAAGMALYEVLRQRSSAPGGEGRKR